MKVVVQVKLLPSPEVAAALAATLRVCNRAADAVSVVAYETGTTSRNELQKLVYARLKAEFGLAAQPAVRVVKKVVDAYATLRGNIRAGNLGPNGSRRRGRAESKPVVFRPDAAQPYDDRILSWQHDARTISIWTVAGRIKNVRYTGHPAQLAMLEKYRRGESDLVHRAGMWFLIATCEIPEAPLNTHPADWIGVDRGIANLATTSDGDNYQGRRLGRYRRWHARKRVAPPTTSPGSTYATAHARRGFWSTDPYHKGPEHLLSLVDATRDRPVRRSSAPRRRWRPSALWTGSARRCRARICA
ncbi:hypothetical protein [Streptomyces sp. NPDC001970]